MLDNTRPNTEQDAPVNDSSETPADPLRDALAEALEATAGIVNDTAEGKIEQDLEKGDGSVASDALAAEDNTSKEEEKETVPAPEAEQEIPLWASESGMDKTAYEAIPEATRTALEGKMSATTDSVETQLQDFYKVDMERNPHMTAPQLHKLALANLRELNKNPRQYAEQILKNLPQQEDEGEDLTKDPEVTALNKRLDDYQRDAEEKVILTAIEKIQAEKDAGGKPAYPHFDTLTERMQQLISSGAYNHISDWGTKLKTAYRASLAENNHLHNQQIKQTQVSKSVAKANNPPPVNNLRSKTPPTPSKTNKTPTSGNGLDEAIRNSVGFAFKDEGQNTNSLNIN